VPEVRVLLVHNRYRLAGGEDAVADDEARLLRQHGFEVKEHFVMNDAPPGIRGAFELIADTAWSHRAYADIRRACHDFNPDIAHVHNFWMKLSPSIHEAFYDEGVPTVQTLHNFRLICPNSLLLRNGRVCEDCVGKTPWRGVTRRCYRNSFVASAAVARMIVVSGRHNIWTEKVSAFIALSGSSLKRFIAGGIPADRIFVKPNFMWRAESHVAPPQHSRDFVYAGRLSEEKGVRVLLDAWSKVVTDRIAGETSSLPDGRLIIAGEGPLLEELQQFTMAKGLGASVEFMGHLPHDRLRQVIGECRAVILPSICLENFPRAIVEAFAAGRPVIASDRGALGDLVGNGRPGVPFRAGDAASLAAAMKFILCDDGLAEVLGKAAQREYEEKYSPEKNLETLLGVYRFAIGRRQQMSSDRAVAAELAAV
jgi:glycosyltransferase involved in cell wall biosynthesis